MTTGRINQVAHETRQQAMRNTYTHSRARTSPATTSRPLARRRPDAHRTHRQCSHADPQQAHECCQLNRKVRRRMYTQRRTLCQRKLRPRTLHTEPRQPSPGAGLHSRSLPNAQCTAAHRTDAAPNPSRPRAPSSGRLDTGMGPRARGCAADTDGAADGARAPHPAKAEEPLRARRTASVLTRRCPLGNRPILSLGRCPSSRLLGR